MSLERCCCRPSHSRRRRSSSDGVSRLPAAIAVFVVGVPANVVALHASGGELNLLGDPELVLTMARLPLARQVPRDVRPSAATDAELFNRLVARCCGERPCAVGTEASPETVASAEFELSVYQTTNPPSGACTQIPSGTPQVLRHGDAIKINGRSVVLRRRIDGRVVAQQTYAAFRGRTLTIVGGSLELVVRPTPSEVPAELCR